MVFRLLYLSSLMACLYCVPAQAQSRPPLGTFKELDDEIEGGTLVVAALDPQGNLIEGFSAGDYTPITTDSVRHVVTWQDNPDCHLLQAWPIRLRFHIKGAKLYAFGPQTRHNHYLQSYD